MEDELNFVAAVLNKNGVIEERKTETLLVPESHEECPLKKTHLWRLRLHEEDKDRAIQVIIENNLMHREDSFFDEVFSSENTVLLHLSHIGGLAIYDIAKRIWWAHGHRGLGTDYVVLAQGAYFGARCIVGNIPELGSKTKKISSP